MPAKKKSVTQAQGKTLEAQLWDAADKMRGSVPPTDYQHVCLGLVFLRYLSAAFARKHAELLETPHADAEDPEEPSGARKTAAGSPKGQRGGDHQFHTPSCVVRCLVAMVAPYNGHTYDPGCGSGGSLPASRLCGVRFATKDRATAHGVVQSEKFVESHRGTAPRESVSSEGEATLRSLSAAKGNRANISIYDRDKWARLQQPKQCNATRRRLAIMNLAIRGIEADIGCACN